MTDQTQRLELATVKAEIGSDIISRFSNDALAAAEITTDSGNIPNLKQVILSIQEDGAEKISFATTIYSTTAAGIAATTNGAIFLVRSADPDEIYAVYSNTAGVAVDTGKRALSATAIQTAMDLALESANAAEDSADLATARTARFLAPVSTPPVIRDDGTPLQIGDRYVNTVDQAEYIYKTDGWVVNDSLAAIADLENASDPAKGAMLVGFDGESVGAQLLVSRKLANYSAFRNYSGTATRVIISKAGIAGDFYPLPTGSDNGGTIIVDALGRPWGRPYSGYANILWFGVVAGEADSTPGIQAAIDACKKIYMPDGVYNFDGYKGSQTVYDNSRRGGFWLTAGVSMIGQSRFGTILKNFADNSTSGLSCRGGDGIELRNFTVDMDWPNKTCAIPSFSTSRGEGLIFWNGESSANDFVCENMHFKNTGHYGIGLQNCAMLRYQILYPTFENIGGDCIDAKDYETYPKDGHTESPMSWGRCGQNATTLGGAEDPAHYDMRGQGSLNNPMIRDLNVYIEPGTGASYMTGVRINGDVDDGAGRRGGKKFEVTGGSIVSSKLASEGSSTVKRIYGVRVGDSFGRVVGTIASNCYYGFVVNQMGTSIPVCSQLIGVTAIDCKGAAADGRAFYLGPNANVTTLIGSAIGCDIGLTSLSVGNDVKVSFKDNTVDHDLTEDLIRQGNYTFVSTLPIVSAIARPTANNYKDNITVWAETKPSISLRSTRNGTQPADLLDGVVRYESADTSGFGATVRVELAMRYTSNNGGSSEWDVRLNSASGMITPFSVRASGPVTPLLGNYTTDALAAAGGVPLGGQYRNGSVVMVRSA